MQNTSLHVSLAQDLQLDTMEKFTMLQLTRREVKPFEVETLKTIGSGLTEDGQFGHNLKNNTVADASAPPKQLLGGIRRYEKAPQRENVNQTRDLMLKSMSREKKKSNSRRKKESNARVKKEGRRQASNPDASVTTERQACKKEPSVERKAVVHESERKEIERQLSKYDMWTRDWLKFVKNKGMLTKVSSMDEAFSFLHTHFQNEQNGRSDTNASANKSDDTQENQKRSSAGMSNGASTISYSESVVCLLVGQIIPTVMGQEDANKVDFLGNSYILLWTVLVITLLLLSCLVIYIRCQCWNKIEVLDDAEKQPFIERRGKERETALWILNLRKHLFGPKSGNSNRQRGGGSEEEFNYTIDRSQKIGSGRVSQVFIASSKGQAVAAKVIHGLDKSTKNFLAKEFRILNRLAHDNIIKVLHFDNQNDTLILELCYVTDPSGHKIYDLKEWSTSCQKKSALTFASVMKQVSDAVHYLHKQMVLHSDLKPQNVLCTGDFNCPRLKLTGNIVL